MEKSGNDLEDIRVARHQRTGTMPLAALPSLLLHTQAGRAAENATPGLFKAALEGPRQDVEEIVYATRGPGRESRFYANFGVLDPDSDRETDDLDPFRMDEQYFRLFQYAPDYWQKQ